MVKRHEGRDSPDSKERDTPTPEDELLDSLSHDMGLSPYTIYYDFLTLLSPYGTKKGLITRSQWRGFFSWCGNIFRKPALIEVFLELARVKAATPLVLQRCLDIPKATVYRVLNELSFRKLVVKKGSFRGTGGRPTTVYALRDHTPEDIKDAIQRDRVTRTPRYTEVQRITQITLDEYLPLLHAKGYEDIYTAEVMAIIKRTQRGFQSRDLYQPVIANLKERGVLVVSCSAKRISLIEV